MSELVTLRRRIEAGSVEERTVDGRAFLVAPMVAVREGVLNGEFLPLDELSRYFNAWEDAPVPVHHPQANGLHVSARTLDQIALAPGRFYDVRLDGPALKGNVYLDVAKAEALGGDAQTALDALRAGDPMDVSTAYYRDIEQTTGTWNGVAYNGIQRNIRPDHVALLPGERGACSWADGCGVPRVNSKDGNMQPTVIEGARGPFLQANIELSLDDKARRVADAWYSAFHPNDEPPTGEAWAWVYEVWDNFVIVSRGAHKQRYPFDMADNGTVSFGEPEEVVVVYEPVPAANLNNTGGETMKDEQKLHANGCGDCPETPTPAANEGEPAGAPETPAGDARSPEMDALLEIVQQFGGIEAFQSTLLQFKANAESERAGLIAALTANSACQFDAAELEAMATEQLRKLDASLRPADYSGRGLPAANRNASEWAPYVAPEVK